MDSSYVFANYSTWEERETQTQYLFQIFFLLYFAPMFALISTFSIIVNRWITLKKNEYLCVFLLFWDVTFNCFQVSPWLFKLGFFFKMIVICYICCIQTGFIVNRVAFYILILIFFFFMFVKWLRWVRHIYS